MVDKTNEAGAKITHIIFKNHDRQKTILDILFTSNIL